MDDLYYIKDRFTMDNLKEYGDLIYNFFKKYPKWYCSARDAVTPETRNYDRMFVEFVNYAIQYASSHKNIKVVVEGIYIYDYIPPEKLDKYAVYIKGTSALISKIRAAKRNHKYDKNNNLKNGFGTNAWKYYITSESKISKYRKYYMNK